MDFRILGPLEVIGDRGRVPLTDGKQKAALAVLLGPEGLNDLMARATAAARARAAELAG